MDHFENAVRDLESPSTRHRPCVPGLQPDNGPGKEAGRSLEAVDLGGLSIQPQAFLLIGEEFLNIFALVALQLNHLSHLGIVDDGAIAGKLFLDDLEDLLLVKLFRKALDRCQSLTTIAFY